MGSKKGTLLESRRLTLLLEGGLAATENLRNFYLENVLCLIFIMPVAAGMASGL